MKVFKFGGASIKDPEAIKNMAAIIKNHSNDNLIVVVSAMGKSTNLLERILGEARSGNIESLEEFVSFHKNICSQLFPSEDEIHKKVAVIINNLKLALESISDYDEHYDQVVSTGEILSSTIIQSYLKHLGLQAAWADARKLIDTDDNFRNGHVNWESSAGNITRLSPLLQENVIITQGFIGSSEGKTTTLGREGSDFSAAIFAHCLDAESMTVWKDVPGILNADPKLIEDAELFLEIPYQEAAEMTYYGASVIHPKTIKPLANKNIPLFVRSFDHPERPGTIIHNCDTKSTIPTIIIKADQCLVSLTVLDYTFINEENLSLIFKELALLDIKINIMQNSAISFSLVIDFREDKLSALIQVLKDHFDIRYNTGLTLITIKNYQKETVEKYRTGKNILLEQTSRNNYRALFSI